MLRRVLALVGVQDAVIFFLAISLILGMLNIVVFGSLPEALERSRLLVLQGSFAYIIVVALTLVFVSFVLASRARRYPALLRIVQVVLLVELFRLLLLCVYVSIFAENHRYLWAGSVEVLVLVLLYALVKLQRRHQLRREPFMGGPRP
jgi:hypothetical protein